MTNDQWVHSFLRLANIRNIKKPNFYAMELKSTILRTDNMQS